MSTSNLSAQVEAAAAEARALARGLSDTQFGWRQEPGRWSIGQCLVHLVRTGEPYLAPLDQALNAAPLAAGDPREPAPGRLGRWTAWSMEPPPRFRMPAQRMIAPPPQTPRDEVVGAFMALQGDFMERLQRAAAREIGAVRVQSPLAGWLRMRVGDCLAFLLAHQRRHLWQARQVREDPRFPAS